MVVRSRHRLVLLAPALAVSAPSCGDGGGDTPLGRVVLVAVLFVAAVSVVAAIAGTRRRRARTHAEQPDERRRVAGTAQWVHDQLSLELMAIPAHEADQRWVSERRHLEDLAVDCRRIADQQDPEIWETMAAILDSLAAALDTCIEARRADDADEHTIGESILEVNRRRAELEDGIDQVWLAM